MPYHDSEMQPSGGPRSGFPPEYPVDCPSDCPGCAHKNLPPDQRLRKKEAWLAARLDFWKPLIDPIQAVPENLRWHYRGKVCLSTQWDRNGWRFGLIKRETVIPIHGCPIHTQQVRQAVALFSSALPPSHLFPLVYYAHSGSQVTLVVKSAQMPEMTWLDEALKNRLQTIGVDGLWLHLHPAAGKKVFAKNVWHLLYGTPQSSDGKGFVYGPRSFQQLIPELYEQAISSAETFLAPDLKDCMVDLYCGSGIGLARWGRHCGHVMGVELDGEAVSNTRINAPEAVVLRGACRDRIPQLKEWAAAQQSAGRRLLYVNPPRTGLESDILRWITADYKPLRMAYLSCSAGTLCRDLCFLENAGYRVIRITPFDFFPNTLHVETLVLIQSPVDTI